MDASVDVKQFGEGMSRDPFGLEQKDPEFCGLFYDFAFDEVVNQDDLDDRFVEACHMIEYVDHLLDVLMFAELEQRVNAVDMLLKGGTIAALEQRLKRLEKEGQHRGEERAIA